MRHLLHRWFAPTIITININIPEDIMSAIQDSITRLDASVAAILAKLATMGDTTAKDAQIADLTKQLDDKQAESDAAAALVNKDADALDAAGNPAP